MGIAVAITLRVRCNTMRHMGDMNEGWGGTRRSKILCLVCPRGHETNKPEGGLFNKVVVVADAHHDGLGP